MNRREWALGATSLALSGLSLPSWAQGGLVEGKDFQRVASPVAVPEGKVDELAKQLLEKQPGIRTEAKNRIDATKALTSATLDLGGLGLAPAAAAA